MDSKHETTPVGVDVTEDIRADYERSAEYRAEWDRQAFAFGIASAIYERRAALGLSQEDLARRIGTTGSVISRIESGRHTASISSLQRIAAALDTHLVVRFEDEPAPVAALG